MQHPDPDDLAVFALEGQPDERLTAHLADCALCRADVDAFRQTADLAQLSNFGEFASRPGEHVWAAITAELGLATTSAAEPVARDAVPTARMPLPSETTSAGFAPTSPATEPPVETAPETATVVDLASAAPARRRGRQRWAVPIAALVVGAALGAGAVAIAQRDSVDIEAVAPLTPVAGGPLPDTAAELGKAELVVAGQRKRIHVDAPDLPAIPGAYEVWLFGADGKMVSLGSLDNGVGDFAVPQGINTGEYRTVDVSDEPADGNPAHSGISVVRGSFS